MTNPTDLGTPKRIGEQLVEAAGLLNVLWPLGHISANVTSSDHAVVTIVAPGAHSLTLHEATQWLADARRHLISLDLGDLEQLIEEADYGKSGWQLVTDGGLRVKGVVPNRAFLATPAATSRHGQAAATVLDEITAAA